MTSWVVQAVQWGIWITGFPFPGMTNAPAVWLGAWVSVSNVTGVCGCWARMSGRGVSCSLVEICLVWA